MLAVGVKIVFNLFYEVKNTMADIDQMTEAGMGLALGRPLVGFVDEFGAIINWVSGGTAKFVPRTAPGAIYATATELDGIEGYHDPEEFRRHTVALLECVVQAEQLSREEIEGVNFSYASLSDMTKKYDPETLKDEFNIMLDGEKIFYISNPALGLWASKNRFNI